MPRVISSVGSLIWFLSNFEFMCDTARNPRRGGSSTQTLKDTAESKQIEIPTDKTCVLVQRRYGSAVGNASLSPRLFRLSRTQPTPILHNELRMTAQIFRDAEVENGLRTYRPYFLG